MPYPDPPPVPQATARRLALYGIAAGALTVAATPNRSSASASWPDRPIRYVVAFTPGSANDILVRAVAPALGQVLGQPIIVENRPGAGGTLGMGAVARAPHDGYTLALASSGALAINQALFRNLSYDGRRDFSAVIPLATTPNLLVVPAASPVDSIEALVERARSGGKPLQFGSSGNGSTQQLVSLRFSQIAGITTEHVPYRGPAEAVAGIAAGDVDFGFVSAPSGLPLVQQGRLRGLGIVREEPLAALPGVPSLLSGPYRDLARTNVWFGIAVGSGTPVAIQDRLHAAGEVALADPAVRQRLVQAGYDLPAASSRAAFQAFVADQFDFWGELVKASGAVID